VCHCLIVHFFTRPKVGRDGTQAEIFARGASAAKTAGDNTKAKANISTEALATDAVAAPEV
jgi:hypothetical protein